MAYCMLLLTSFIHFLSHSMFEQSGGLSATHLNLARTICRRAERSVVPLVEAGMVDGEVGRYLNRLSDLLFAAQRTASYREKKEEILWIKATD